MHFFLIKIFSFGFAKFRNGNVKNKHRHIEIFVSLFKHSVIHERGSIRPEGVQDSKVETFIRFLQKWCKENICIG
jgi:hypothetical protein